MGGSSRESGYRKKGGEGERQREKDNEGIKERERKFREIEGVERERGGRQEDESERGQSRRLSRYISISFTTKLHANLS